MTQTINGMQAKQLGLDLAELHDGAWLESMRAHAKRISAECGMVTTDDLRLYGASYGLYSMSPNSYGAIFRGKGWTMVGRKKSIIPSNHARELKIWKWEGR